MALFLRCKSLLGMCLFTSFISIAETQETSIPTSNDFEIGERWEWARINNETKLPEWNFFRSIVEKDGTKLFFDGKNHTQITQVFFDGKSRKPWRVWPIKVGRQWEYENEYKQADGTLFAVSQNVEVVSFEEVIVTAGKFMAYKIMYKGSARNSRGTFTQNDIYWYAPSIRAYVKFTSEDGKGYFYQRELVKYLIK